MKKKYTSLFAGIAADLNTKNFSRGAESVWQDTKNLKEVLDVFEKAGIDQTKGRAFEFLEVLKFNYNAALQNSNLKAEATHFNNPLGPSDINIFKGDELLREIQAKSSSKVTSAIFEQAQAKYEGMGRLIHSDQAIRAEELLKSRINSKGIKASDYEDVQKNLMGELNQDGVSSGGTTLEESIFTVEHPLVKELEFKLESLSKEVGAGAAKGIIYGALAGVIFKGAQNIYQVSKGVKNVKLGLVDTLTSGAENAARSCFIGGGAKGVSFLFRRMGQNGFSETMGPAIIASSVLEMSHLIRQYSKGDIDKELFLFSCGGSIFKSTSIFYYGLAGQVAIPIPVVGGLIGALSGLMCSTLLYESGLLGVGHNNIIAAAKKERLVAEEIAKHAEEKMTFYTEQIDEIQLKYKEHFKDKISDPLMLVRNCILDGDYKSGFGILLEINRVFKEPLPFETIEEFDLFMNKKIVF